MEKLTTRWSDCTQDLSCHNSENWPQRNGNKCAPEMKIHRTYNNQDDVGQNTDDQFEDVEMTVFFLPVILPLCL